MSAKPTDLDHTETSLRNLSASFEGQAQGYRNVAAAERHRLTATTHAAILAVAAVLDAIAFSLAESIHEGHAAPVQHLAAQADEWLEAAATFDLPATVDAAGQLATGG
jgi:hypothetical protein